MDLLDLTAAELSQSCLDLFGRCLAPPSQTQNDGKTSPSQEQVEAASTNERLEYKLADFNLWIDGIGALASSRASLDWRLNERPIDLALVKGNLVMLYQSLEDYSDLQNKHQALEKALLDIESALGSLASLALAVRRTGKRSRLHKADRLFNEEEHSELKKHLECIAVLRPKEGGYSSHRFKQKLEALTPVQQRLVIANLRRRNRFLQARRHSTGLKRRKPDLSSISEDAFSQAHQPVASPDLEIPIPAHPIADQPPKFSKHSDAPTISGTSASVPESKLRYTDPVRKKSETSTPRTEVTRITATAHYPRPQLPDDNQHMFQCPCCYQTLPVQDMKTNARWRKHLSEDICPYTCVVEDCPTPDVYYSTRTALERHIRQDHSPTWQCPLCSDEPQFASMTDMMEHFMASHPDAAEGDISTLISLSTQRKIGIEACPLCDVEGIVDSPELIDHVLEHIHDFSLRSLPWPRSNHINPGGEVGTFDLGHSKCPSVIQWLGGVTEADGHRRAQLSQFDHNRVAIVESQVPLSQDYDLPDEICFADEHGDGSAAAETDISRLTQETLSSSEMTNNAEDITQSSIQNSYDIVLEPTIDKRETKPASESTTSRFRNRIRKVFNLGTAKPDSSDASVTQKDRDGDTKSHPPVYRAAVDLFNRLKDRKETLSMTAFNEFVRQQHPSGHEYDEVFSIKETYGFAAFYSAWVDLDPSAQGPLPPKDFSMPLTNYFISSSHNTYLSGNQLASKASAETYRDILMQGCRFVEMDVWNGDSVEPKTQDPSRDQQVGTSTRKARKMHKRRPWMESGEPIVTHGWRLTTPCGFREVCTVIGTSAFVNNDLPVIVSLEVHADAEQQEAMVRIMKEEWGELLLDEPLEDCDPRFQLPKLGDLRRRILVKVKRSPARVIKNDPSSDSESSIRGVYLLNDSNPKKRPRVVISQALSDLAIYTHSEAFRSLDTPAARRPSHIFSLSERKLLELNESDKPGLFRHNKNFLMRCFPSGSRIDSSNLDPTLFWRLGVQMVGMTWQNLDEGMMLHHGMFTDEDGWVLKPLGYRSPDRTGETQLYALPTGYKDIDITILSGFDIPDSVEDAEDNSRRNTRVLRPQVKVELYGTRFGGDGDPYRYRFKTETGKTRNPRFGATGSTASFAIKGTLPELSFVRFKVVDDQKSFGVQPLLGWACIRLDRLREGYRLIELFDAEGHRTSGLLLISHFKREGEVRMEIS